MSLAFTTTTKVSVSNGVKMLVYGPSGAGKTLLCATAPAPIILSAESGLLSLNPQNQQRILGKAIDIPVIPIKTYLDLENAYTWLANDPYSKQHIQTVCLDSLSEIAEVVLQDLLPQFKDPRKAYGEMAIKIVGMVKGFRDFLGKNVYIIAKQDKIMDGGTGALVFGPSFPGRQLASELPYLFDEVFNLNVSKDNEGKTFRYLRTQPDPQYQAKDSSGALAEIEQPNLNNIINKIINHD